MTLTPALRSALERERNHLAHSFGHGSFEDGRVRDRIREIDTQLAPPDRGPEFDLQEACEFE